MNGGPVERAALVGLSCSGLEGFDNATDETIEELSELLRTAGGEHVITVMQNRRSPDTRTFIGQGKLMELKEAIEANELNLVVFDNDLSPSQARAIEGELSCRVIDRTALILDIFASRANTREGRLQVELAQYKYLLPRLLGMWRHLVRQTASGGKSPIGTRGPGETQLETDRRHIRRKIQKIESEIEDVRKVRATQRGQRVRREVPLVCLVGYTNAGKSTLLNALTGAGVHAEDRLFDTLDPTSKRLKTESGELILSDTVGFIRKLPHLLIDAFRATLEELRFADLLIHVVDASNPLWREQMQVVEAIIADLNVGETPRITVMNKVDLLTEGLFPRVTDAVYCSARRGMGMEALRERMMSELALDMISAQLTLPYSRAGMIDEIYRRAEVTSLDYREDGIHVAIKSDRRTHEQLLRQAFGGERP